MKRILHAVEAWMDDFKIKNKFFDDIIIKILDFFKRVCYNLIRKFIFLAQDGRITTE